MRTLGLAAELLGGAGRTDVLVTVTAPTGGVTRIIVDGKSAASGSVDENRINFDTLREHRDKHAAKYAMVVAPGFAEGRVHQRADTNDVVLCTTAELAEMLRRQTAAPLGPQRLVDLFRRGRRQVVEDEWTRRRYDADLLCEVLRAMAEESRDPDSGAEGAFSADTVRVMVKQTLTPAPNIDRVKQVLELLASPLVGAVTVTAGRYALVEEPAATACRLQVLQATVAAAVEI